MIKIIDYGMGNCGSIRNMIRYLGGNAEIVDEPVLLEGASAIILPGVGSFDNGVRHLEPFKDELLRQVSQNAVPFLGVCLGMQLLFESSEEGCLKGLGLLKGHVEKFDFTNVNSPRKLHVPHMGWNTVDCESKFELFKNLPLDARFYFVHSFHAPLECLATNSVFTNYGYKFPSAVHHDNIFGVQFHPEKSHTFGKIVFKNFLEYSKCLEPE